MGFDGFRFDLASLFTRNEDGSINLEDPPVMAEISAMPELAQLRLIAEAWDLASYQLGRSFPETSCLQWNGEFRDTIRRFLKGDGGIVGPMMSRLYGSSDLFPDDLMNAYHPYQSVNYVTCHDGSASMIGSVAKRRNESDRHGRSCDGTGQHCLRGDILNPRSSSCAFAGIFDMR
jgi:glycogen operon protein